MRSAGPGAWALLRLELLTTLRTREIYTYGFAPMLLTGPLLVMVLLLGLGLTRSTRLAIPPEMPASFERSFVATAVLVRDADPRRAVEEGRADVALVDWRATKDEVSVRIHPLDSPHGETIRDGLRRALREEFQAALETAGEPSQSWRIAEVKNPGVRDLERVGWVILVIGMAYMLVFLIPSRTATERQEGFLEALAVAPMSLVWWVGARALVGASVAFGLLVLPVAVAIALTGSAGVPILMESFLLVVGVGASMVGISLFGSSARQGLEFGVIGYLVILTCGVVAWWLGAPEWLPIVGLGSEGASAQAMRIVLTAGCAVAATVLTASTIRRCGRVFPAGGA